MTKTSKLLLAAAGALSVCLGVFTFLDLSISNALRGQLPGFSRFFEVIGMLPMFLILLVAPLVLIWNSVGKHRIKMALLSILALFAALATVYQTTLFYFHENTASTMEQLPLILVLSCVLILTVIYLFKKLGKETLAYGQFFAVAALIFLAFDAITIEVIKQFFGRVRPRELGLDGNVFTFWFVINGNTGHSSFPSGHSAYAFAAFMWALWWKSGSRSRKIALLVALAFWLTVAVSRVLIGAHFPSDVTMSALISLGYATLAIYLTKRIVRH